MIGVSKVACRTHERLDEVGISQVSGNKVNFSTELVTKASGYITDSHVWPTNRQVVANSSFHITLLNYVPRNQTALRQSHHIKLVVKLRIRFNRLTSGLCLLFEVQEERRETALGNLNTVRVRTRLLGDLSSKVVHAGI